MSDTVSNFLSGMIRTLRENGVFEPNVSAERILSAITGLNRAELYSGTDKLIYPPQIHSAKAAMERRIKGEPVAYIIGECEFYNVILKIDKRVLEPRPETEILVDEVIKYLRERHGPLRVVDIGTGSGNIAISLAYNVPDLQVAATDIDAAVLELAQENAEAMKVSGRIDFRMGELFAPLLGDAGQFDAVVSNPPYVGDDEMELLPIEVGKFEPHRALFAGIDGLAIIKRLIEEAPVYLKEDGFLAIEIGYDQEAAVRHLMNFNFRNVRIIADLAGKPRVAIGFMRKL